jgi:hypothetical protein
MGFSPLLDTPGVIGASEIIPVLWLIQPLTLTGLFAGLATLFFGAVSLPVYVSGIRKKNRVTILALALSDSDHRLATSQWPTIMSQIKKHGKEDRGRKLFKFNGLKQNGPE